MTLLGIILGLIGVLLIGALCRAAYLYRRDIDHGWDWSNMRLELTPEGMRYVNVETAMVYTAEQAERLARAPIVLLRAIPDMARPEHEHAGGVGE